MQCMWGAAFHHDIVPGHITGTLSKKSHGSSNICTRHSRKKKFTAAGSDIISNSNKKRNHNGSSCCCIGDTRHKRCCQTGQKNQHTRILFITDNKILRMIDQLCFRKPRTDHKHCNKHNNICVNKSTECFSRGSDSCQDKCDHNSGRNDCNRNFAGCKSNNRYQQDH